MQARILNEIAGEKLSDPFGYRHTANRSGAFPRGPLYASCKRS